MGGTRVEKQSLACSTNVFICSPLVSQELHCSQFESARGIRCLTFVFAWGPVCFPLVSEDLYCSRFKSPPGVRMGGWGEPGRKGTDFRTNGVWYLVLARNAWVDAPNSWPSYRRGG